MTFIIKRSTLTTLEGQLFLTSDVGHCHGLSSVKKLLESKTFLEHNPHLIPIFKKALKMMEQDEEGEVNLTQRLNTYDSLLSIKSRRTGLVRIQFN